jgi:hypothetical protein
MPSSRQDTCRGWRKGYTHVAAAREAWCIGSLSDEAPLSKGGVNVPCCAADGSGGCSTLPILVHRRRLYRVLLSSVRSLCLTLMVAGVD